MRAFMHGFTSPWLGGNPPEFNITALQLFSWIYHGLCVVYFIIAVINGILKYKSKKISQVTVK